MANRISKLTFRVEEFVQYTDPPRFEARLDPSTPPDGNYAGAGKTAYEAVKNLCAYLSKEAHSDELWMAEGG